jgi:hypothetical protein
LNPAATRSRQSAPFSSTNRPCDRTCSSPSWQRLHRSVAPGALAATAIAHRERLRQASPWLRRTRPDRAAHRSGRRSRRHASRCRLLTMIRLRCRSRMPAPDRDRPNSRNQRGTMRRAIVAWVTVGAVVAGCSAARQQKPDLPPPEYEPARSLDIAPPAAPATAPPATSSNPAPED